jgi:1,5-anhydro-D-fructose reductase (1,5-anhydro-D-mannitol-forming)
MPKTRVRYAIIGFGGIAENRIAKEGFACDRIRFRPLPGVELRGAADILSRRRRAAEGLGLKWYESPEAVFADPAVDAVFITSNNASHFSLGKKALQSGKHVILEKPMATGLAEARKLTALAAKQKLSLSVDHMMAQNAYNRKARELVAQGTLGKVNDICLHMEFCYGSTPEEAAAWRCADPAELGGPIGDVGSHCLYMAEFLTGSRIQSVAAVFTPRTLRICAENGAFIRFRMENGLVGSIRVSFNDPRGNLESTLLNLGYEIYGTQRILRAYGTLFQLSGHRDEQVKIRLNLEGDGKVEVLRLANVRNIYQQIVLEHAQSIRSGRRLTGEDGLDNLRLVLAAYRSAEHDGKEIRVIRRRPT